MDRILESQLTDFCNKHNISPKENLSTKFEHFVNFLFFVSNCPAAYSIQRDTHVKVHTGKGGDNGLDGILIVINDNPVFTLQDAKGIIEQLGNRSLQVEFYFTQAKTSSSFETGDMLKTREGIKHFFSKREPSNKEIKNFWKIQDYIFNHAAQFRSNPTCKIAYATTGKWEQNEDQLIFISDTKKEISNLGLFSEVVWESIDANGLQALYKNLNNAIQKQIKFEKKATFPSIQGVSESYVGLLEGSHFIELISMEGRLNKSVFYENVRAFLGDNSVNKEIAATINNEDTRNLFPILNNGITIVARAMNFVGDNLTIQDFQIVNGCQTSNILYQSKDKLAGMMIPVKIIASEDQDIINMIIQSTNRQTSVNPEAFESIKSIHKKIQSYYDTYTTSDRIYYERRNREYDKNNRDLNIKSNQIFTIPMQLMCHVAMFLDAPHLSEREYYGKILRTFANEVFQDTDHPIVYYTSARTLYKVEKWIHAQKPEIKKVIKNYRFHYLMVIRRLIDKSNGKIWLNSHAAENLCQKILAEIEDERKFESLIRKSSDIIEESSKKAYRKTSRKKRFVDLRLLTQVIIKSFATSK